MVGKWLCVVETLSGVTRNSYQQITPIKPFAGFTGCAENHVNIASAGIMLSELRRTASEIIQQILKDFILILYICYCVLMTKINVLIKKF